MIDVRIDQEADRLGPQFDDAMLGVLIDIVDTSYEVSEELSDVEDDWVRRIGFIAITNAADTDAALEDAFREATGWKPDKRARSPIGVTSKERARRRSLKELKREFHDWRDDFDEVDTFAAAAYDAVAKLQDDGFGESVRSLYRSSPWDLNFRSLHPQYFAAAVHPTDANTMQGLKREIQQSHHDDATVAIPVLDFYGDTFSGEISGEERHRLIVEAISDDSVTGADLAEMLLMDEQMIAWHGQANSIKRYNKAFSAEDFDVNKINNYEKMAVVALWAIPHNPKVAARLMEQMRTSDLPTPSKGVKIATDDEVARAAMLRAEMLPKIVEARSRSRRRYKDKDELRLSVATNALFRDSSDLSRQLKVYKAGGRGDKVPEAEIIARRQIRPGDQRENARLIVDTVTTRDGFNDVEDLLESDDLAIVDRAARILAFAQDGGIEKLFKSIPYLDRKNQVIVAFNGILALAYAERLEIEPWAASALKRLVVHYLDVKDAAQPGYAAARDELTAIELAHYELADMSIFEEEATLGHVRDLIDSIDDIDLQDEIRREFAAKFSSQHTSAGSPDWLMEGDRTSAAALQYDGARVAAAAASAALAGSTESEQDPVR